ncbi:hypothetical protein GH714_028163 [Hevea brasiliensis]|uniref:Uncharacterized protein n=1 Tax=Hevea brasiliensis TaxID=3981 RepID=A0A6A6LRT8_HEVBR|nr:hypothetical protein GH714_028163 [Hevea brasiliensis]
MTEEYKKYHELAGDFEQITDIVIGNTQKTEYVKRQLRVLKVNLSEWNDGLLASEVGSENVGVANFDSSVAILNPHEARSRGKCTWLSWYLYKSWWRWNANEPTSKYCAHW